MRIWALPVGATLVSVGFVAIQRSATSKGVDVTALSNGAQLLAAMLASAGCALASRRGTGRQRRAWRWLAAGTGCWAAGQAVWSWYEVVLGEEVPFPSLADVGFLAFPMVAGVGLVMWPGGRSRHAFARGRDVMDGAIIAVSLLVLSWVTVMSPLVGDSGGSGSSLALSLAYPVGDVVLATLVLLMLSTSETERMTLGLLALGLGGFALADSLFSYLTGSGTYSSADLVSSGGWVTGFLFVAVAAISSQASGPVTATVATTRTSWVWLLLPYLPLLGAGAALVADMVTTDSSELVDLVLGVGLVVLVLARQFLAMADNQHLVQALGEAGVQLQHTATHDALTGLPNRALFAQRLDHALSSPSSRVSLLFCDLDNFKPVNDELGHAAGDQLLQLVADRLLGCVRATDTVARLGGDEFAILLQDCPDSQLIADRVVASMDQETRVLGRAVHPSISVGLAEHDGTPPSATSQQVAVDATPERRTPSWSRVTTDQAAADVAAAMRESAAARLLRRADTAMYAAKAAGKGRAVALLSDSPQVAATAPS